jgi:hypothetical protein
MRTVVRVGNACRLLLRLRLMEWRLRLRLRLSRLRGELQGLCMVWAWCDVMGLW